MKVNNLPDKLSYIKRIPLFLHLSYLSSVNYDEV